MVPGTAGAVPALVRSRTGRTQPPNPDARPPRRSFAFAYSHPGTHRTPEAAEAGRTWAAGCTVVIAEDEAADEAEEALDDDENDPAFGEQGAAKRRRVLIDVCVPDTVLAVCRPVRRGAAFQPYHV